MWLFNCLIKNACDTVDQMLDEEKEPLKPTGIIGSRWKLQRWIVQRRCKGLISPSFPRHSFSFSFFHHYMCQ
jgi:hypothetical protein